MARLRKGVAYRTLERPYTRFSKFRKKSFIRASPNVKIVRFDMGNLTRSFKYRVDLVSTKGLQVRQESVESARKSCNRVLESGVGKHNYHFQIRIHPFHVLRENPIAKGAGADRFSTGMSHAFGKPIGLASQVREGQQMFSVFVNKEHLKSARKALQRANYKLPVSCRIQVNEIK